MDETEEHEEREDVEDRAEGETDLNGSCGVGCDDDEHGKEEEEEEDDDDDGDGDDNVESLYVVDGTRCLRFTFPI